MRVFFRSSRLPVRCFEMSADRLVAVCLPFCFARNVVLSLRVEGNEAAVLWWALFLDFRLSGSKLGEWSLLIETEACFILLTRGFTLDAFIYCSFLAALCLRHVMSSDLIRIALSKGQIGPSCPIITLGTNLFLSSTLRSVFFSYLALIEERIWALSFAVSFSLFSELIMSSYFLSLFCLSSSTLNVGIFLHSNCTRLSCCFFTTLFVIKLGIAGTVDF